MTGPHRGGRLPRTARYNAAWEEVCSTRRAHLVGPVADVSRQAARCMNYECDFPVEALCALLGTIGFETTESERYHLSDEPEEWRAQGAWLAAFIARYAPDELCVLAPRAGA